MIPLSNLDMLRTNDKAPEAPFVHPLALVDGASIGARTRVWAFAHALPGARVGCDCNLCDHTLIEGEAVVGDRVTIKSGVYVWSGARIDDDVFIGPNVTFTNDHHPRSRRYPNEFATIVIERGASIGAGAVLLPGIVIGEYAMIGAGSVVTRSAPAHALVYGNPARQVGAVCRCGTRLTDTETPPLCRSCIAESNADRAFDAKVVA